MKREKNIARHSFRVTLRLIGLLVMTTFALQPVALAQNNPSWVPTGSLNAPRTDHTATLLPDGKVLVVGGSDGNSPPNYLNSAELYDPVTGAWTVTGSLNTPLYLHTATLLANGKVLVVGGASAELYDPTTGTWSITGSLNIARYLPTATLLQNGKVLVAGGTGGDNRAELYDPATGTWSVTGGLLTDRYGQTATLLQNGQVLVAGGWVEDVISTSLASAELYDPVTGTWSVTGNLNASRLLHTATLLPDGRVLIAAGYTDNWVPANGGFAASPTSLNSAELYDPATGTWSVTASLNTRLSGHTATLLPNGKVLVAGGSYVTIDGNTPNDGTYPCGVTLTCSAKALDTSEVYDSATGSWTATANLNAARVSHTATLLQNGNVLIAGGSNVESHSSSILNSAELYDPETGGVTSITPAPLYLAAAPASFTITGEGFANLGFGLPVVNFTRNGVILAAVRATSGTDTNLTVPFPGTNGGAYPGLSVGLVSVEVYNQSGPNSWDFVGSTFLTVNDGQPPPGVNSLTPDPIDLATPPGSFTVSGNGFMNSGFGLSVVNFTRNGFILAAARATSGTSTSLTIPFPGTNGGAYPGLSGGQVTVAVWNQTGANKWSFIGSTSLTVNDTGHDPGVITFTPNPMDLATPPTSFTITGNGFMNSGFGLSVVNFTRNGFILAAARATAGTNASLTVPFPGTNGGAYPGLSGGQVTVEVWNQTGSNSWSFVGSVPLTVTDSVSAQLAVNSAEQS